MGSLFLLNSLHPSLEKKGSSVPNFGSQKKALNLYGPSSFPSKKSAFKQSVRNTLGLAKTYILRGTPQTYAMKTRAVTDN